MPKIKKFYAPPRGGAPTKENRTGKTERLTFLITPEDKKQLISAAGKKFLTLTEYVVNPAVEKARNANLLG
jgi:uncharacterized protein (DUF1778 family)